MQIIDIIICALLVVGLILGLLNGLVKQIASFAGLVCGLLLGRMLYLPVGEWLVTTLSFSAGAARITAFILILVVVPLLFSVLGWLVTKMLQAVKLGWINRLLGALVGVLKFALLAGVIITGIELCDRHNTFIAKEKKEASVLYYPLYNAAGIFFDGVKGEFQGL